MQDQKTAANSFSAARKKTSEVYVRQMALNKKYRDNPKLALITDSSEIIGANLHDPFRTTVCINGKMKVPFKIGVHEAVGGDHDFPNPGDILCASLAACFESTARLIANRLEIELTETRIRVSAEVDVRGTLMIDTTVPVGFRSMHVDVLLAAANSDEKMLHTLIGAVKRSCIIYHTLKESIPISFHVEVETRNIK
jgi:uncharacterized OsmC-like protein